MTWAVPRWSPRPRRARRCWRARSGCGLRAVGVNFRDVLIGLGMVADGRVLGMEGAGVVLEAGPGVSGLAPGRR